ncbi:MAG: hypothetical protein QM702_20655 [Rubrivivax sp.]
MSASDVINAIAAQNSDPPIGNRQYRRDRVQHQHARLARHHRRPQRLAGAQPERRHHLSAGHPPSCTTAIRRRPTSCARTDGAGAAVNLQERGSSTLQIVDQIKEMLRRSRRSAQGVELTQLFDQSVFVRAAVSSVIHEAVIAGCLTAR